MIALGEQQERTPRVQVKLAVKGSIQSLKVSDKSSPIHLPSCIGLSLQLFMKLSAMEGGKRQSYGEETEVTGWEHCHVLKCLIFKIISLEDLLS